MIRAGIRGIKASWRKSSPVFLSRAVPLPAVVGLLVLLAIFFRCDVRPVDDAGFVII